MKFICKIIGFHWIKESEKGHCYYCVFCRKASGSREGVYI